MNVNLFQNKLLAHILIWLSYFILMAWFFADIFGFKSALIRSLILVCLHTGIFYLNSIVLLPKLLEKKKRLLYYLVVIMIVMLSIFLFKFIDDVYFINELKYLPFNKSLENLPVELREEIVNWQQKNPVPHDRRFINMRFITNGIFAIIILLISSLYRNWIVNREKEEEAILLKNQMLEAESQILKWQINPHFLFNTLNNIYALSQMKSDRAPDAIHRLSEMLRYVIYDCNEEFVSLKHEINYLKGYIALQLLKDDEISNVHYEFVDVNTNLKIAPMLLISFVENSFKHSKIEDINNGWVDIKLRTTKNELELIVKNSIPEIEASKDKQGGLGLENVKRRLELIYHQKYNLTIKKTKKDYSVYLTLKLNEN